MARHDEMPFVYDDGGRAAAGYKGKAGDCGTRAVAIATGVPYQTVYEAINAEAQKERPRGKAKRSDARNGVWPKTLGRVLEAHGFRWVPTMRIGSGATVHLVPGELPARGRLVVRVSRHYTAVIDGVIRDTHDPQRTTLHLGADGGVDRVSHRCVYGMWADHEALQFLRATEVAR